jgi:chromo domain-containing protein 1
MEGFQDTNPGLLRMAHHLRQTNVMAIFYPQNPKGDVWLAFSRASPDFDFLDLKLDTQKVPNGAPLLLAVRAALPPFSSLPAFEETPSDMGALISDDPFAGVEKSTDSTPHIQQVTNVPQNQGTGAMAASMLTNEDKEGILKSFFASTLRTSINDLNRLSDSSTAENFFLFFPPEEEEEFQIMQRWLSWNNMTVYSNRDKNGWSRFMDNSKRGVLIVR